MKYARYCEDMGYEYQYVRGCVDIRYNPDVILMSFTFTFYHRIYEKTIDYYLLKCPNAKIIVGGVFPSIFPEWFDKEKWNGTATNTESFVNVHIGLDVKINDLVPKYNVDIVSEDKLYDRNYLPMYSSRGCINNCAYCVVPKIEGKIKCFKSISKYLEKAKIEMPDAEYISMYDNNFTAQWYIEDIVNELVEYGLPVDFNQGLYAKLFVKNVHLFEKLKYKHLIRFAYDREEDLEDIWKAYKTFTNSNVSADFFLYMLWNFKDSPEDIWNRFMECKKMIDEYGGTIFIYPMKYEPFSPYIKKNEYTGEKWNPKLKLGFQNMVTRNRGFISLSTTDYVYRYIGNSSDEFKSKCLDKGTYKKYKAPEGIMTV